MKIYQFFITFKILLKSINLLYQNYQFYIFLHPISDIFLCSFSYHLQSYAYQLLYFYFYKSILYN